MRRSRSIFILMAVALGVAIFFKKTFPPDQIDTLKVSPTIQNFATVEPKAINPLPIQSANLRPAPKEISTSEVPRLLTATEIEELRAKTKGFLANLYTSQRAFHAEYDQYVTDIHAMAIYRYPILPFKAGFLEASELSTDIPADAKVDTRRLSTDDIIGDKDSSTDEAYQYAPFVREIDLSAYKEFCRNGCTANKEGFEMLIATPLGNSDQIDVWILNDKKEFILVHDGTKSRIE